MLFIQRELDKENKKSQMLLATFFEKEHVRYNLSFNIYHLALRRYYQLRKL